MTQQAAAEQQVRLYELFMQAPAAICVVRGPDLVFEMANPHYHSIVNRANVVGRPSLEALPELKGQGFERLVARVMATGVPYVAREALARIDRLGDGALDEGYFNFTYAPLQDNAGVVDCVMVFGIEVTGQVLARKKIEAARQDAGEPARQCPEVHARRWAHRGVVRT